MLENSLHVNLLLIGIITQLASYPQPLLRSFLLNTNMVFQPSVRSLYQVPPGPRYRRAPALRIPAGEARLMHRPRPRPRPAPPLVPAHTCCQRRG